MILLDIFVTVLRQRLLCFVGIVRWRSQRILLWVWWILDVVLFFNIFGFQVFYILRNNVHVCWRWCVRRRNRWEIIYPSWSCRDLDWGLGWRTFLLKGWIDLFCLYSILPAMLCGLLGRKICFNPSSLLRECWPTYSRRSWVAVHQCRQKHLFLF